MVPPGNPSRTPGGWGASFGSAQEGNLHLSSYLYLYLWSELDTENNSSRPDRRVWPGPSSGLPVLTLLPDLTNERAGCPHLTLLMRFSSLELFSV